MLQARTFDDSLNPIFEASNIVSGTFVAVHDELRGRTSDIPLMIIDTLTRELSNPDSNDLVPTNTVLFEVTGDTPRSSIDGGSVDYLGRAGARVRGSSTVGQPKTNMTVETWGPNGTGPEDDFATGLLGMAADSD